MTTKLNIWKNHVVFDTLHHQPQSRLFRSKSPKGAYIILKSLLYKDTYSDNRAGKDSTRYSRATSYYLQLLLKVTRYSLCISIFHLTTQVLEHTFKWSTTPFHMRTEVPQRSLEEECPANQAIRAAIHEEWGLILRSFHRKHSCPTSTTTV